MCPEQCASTKNVHLCLQLCPEQVVRSAYHQWLYDRAVCVSARACVCLCVCVCVCVYDGVCEYDVYNVYDSVCECVCACMCVCVH